MHDVIVHGKAVNSDTFSLMRHGIEKTKGEEKCRSQMYECGKLQKKER